MAEYELKPPLSEDEIRKLRVHDVVKINGTLFGIRDATQIRIFDEGKEPPADLDGSVCLHTAPGVRKVDDGYEKVCIGTTTSPRMERFTPPLIKEYGVRAIVGKGGLLEGSTKAMEEYGAAYFAIVGGAAALSTHQIKEIQEVWWEDLMPECLWKFKVEDFGPLIVAIDAKGNSLYSEVDNKARERLKTLSL